MTDEGDTERVLGMTKQDLLGFNQQIIEEFRTSGGHCGGRFEGNPMILLTTTGAKSGRSLTSPLSFCADGDACIVFASAGGSPKHPAWYHNVVAHPDVTVERGDEAYAAHAVITEGAERQAAFDRMVAALPRFADYQDAAEREIPVIRLVRSAQP